MKYINKIAKQRKIIDIYYFVAPLKQDLNPQTYSKQQKMLSRLRKSGVIIILCKRSKRDSEDGKEIHKIKEDDIRLALQMQKDAYHNKFDTALLFSGDGDFAPLPEYIREKGKRMEVIYFENSISIGLLRACEFKGIKIDKKILNKFFLRE